MEKRSICVCRSFIYRYESYAVLYLDGNRLRYWVTLGIDHWITIEPSTFPGSDSVIVWSQSARFGELIQPLNLIQALGEGIGAMSYE